MDNEIKPERIEELLHWLRKLDNGNTVTGILKAGELRTLLRVYQQVRGLPEKWRNYASDPLRCGSGVAEGMSSCADELDRAIAEADGEGNHAGG